MHKWIFTSTRKNACASLHFPLNSTRHSDRMNAGARTEVLNRGWNQPSPDWWRTCLFSLNVLSSCWNCALEPESVHLICRMALRFLLKTVDFFCFLFMPLLLKIMALLPVLEAALSRPSASLWGIVEPSLMYSTVCYIALYEPGGVL